MKYLYLSTRTVCLFITISLSAAGFGQDPLSALETTRKIADKIIRETSFDYTLLPLSFNGGISSFQLKEQSGAGESPICYAFGRMNSGLDTTGLLALSFSGTIRISLNGEEVFRGTSGEALVQEYTYDRYHFQNSIPVRWLKGENLLMVKCDLRSGPVKVLLLPVNEIDEKLPYVDPVAVSEDMPYALWLTCGPWQATPEQGIDQGFPPDHGFKTYYKQEGNIMAWKVEETPLVRELSISKSNSYVRDSYADWHYANGGTMLGILSLFEATGDGKYLQFVRQFADNLVENNNYFRWQYFNLHAMRGNFHRFYRMTMLDDSGGPALPLVEMASTQGDGTLYRELIDPVYRYVMDGQERLADGTFCRPEPEPATVWADDLFMSVPFLLRMAEIRGDETLYDEVARQVIQFNKYLCDSETGLYFHGWYDQRQEHTPVRWSRANGWIVWAESEALLYMPKKHPDYQTILKIFRNHMKAIASVQDPSGMWHQVADHPETWEESSCTAMFTLAMARGVRMGWLDKSYREKALKGWNALQDKIREDGTVVDICQGTGIGDDVAFYAGRKRFDHDPRGLGAMITAGCEISLLEK